MHVDAAVAGCICTLPWGRFETLLAAKIIEADPEAGRRAGQDLGGGTVRTGRPHRTIGVETA